MRCTQVYHGSLSWTYEKCDLSTFLSTRDAIWDKTAVVAGLTLAYSNGVVEGHVNRLKLIKRMMYGRAGFALLRQRVLHAA
jgi:transposase